LRFSADDWGMIPKAVRLCPARHPWMTEPALRSIMAAIRKAGGEARFVGGAVRDALLGREADEVDLAVNMPPQKVIQVLKAAGIQAIPTGLAHGTVTAVSDHKGYEITTLRRDVETDGRHAQVSFVGDWKTDASRRDFTINAIYADETGKLYDYFGGLKDLRSGTVRFIGDPCQRIHEDVLRILRFFRFFAWYGKGAVNRDAFESCKKLAPLLKGLSAERVWKEIKRILLAPDPIPVLRLMIKAHVLQRAVPRARALGKLEKMVRLEQKNGLNPCHLRRLAALLNDGSANADFLARKLKFSNMETKRFKDMIMLSGKIRGKKLTREFLRRLLYQAGRETVRDGVLLSAAKGKTAGLPKALAVIDAWENPFFPVQGKDVVRLGFKPGPQIGRIVRAVESWWCGKDFRPEREACLEELKRLVERRKL